MKDINAHYEILPVENGYTLEYFKERTIKTHHDSLESLFEELKKVEKIRTRPASMKTNFEVVKTENGRFTILYLRRGEDGEIIKTPGGLGNDFSTEEEARSFVTGFIDDPMNGLINCRVSYAIGAAPPWLGCQGKL